MSQKRLTITLSSTDSKAPASSQTRHRHARTAILVTIAHVLLAVIITLLLHGCYQ